MSSGIRDFSTVFSSRLITLCAQLGIQSCLAWFLGPEDRGSYAVCLMYSSLLSLILIINFDDAGVYFISSKRINLSQGITYTLIYGGAGSVLAIGVGLVLMKLPLAIFEKATPTAFYLALASIPCSLFSMTFMRLLTAVHQFGWYAAMMVGNILIHLIFTILFVWVFAWSVNGAISAIPVTSILVIAVTLIFLRWKYKITLVKLPLRLFRDILHYGARYHLGKISSTMYLYVGTLILASLTTKEQVGWFDVAIKLTAQIMLIPNALITILMPRVAGDKQGKAHLIAQCARLTGLICAGLSLILAVLAKPIVSFLFSPEFLPSVLLIQTIAIGVAIRCGCKVFDSYLLGTDHPGSLSISNAAGTVTNFTILLVLLPYIGLIAAGVSVTVGFCMSSSLLTFLFLKYSRLKPTQLLRFRRTDWGPLSNVLQRRLGGSTASTKNPRKL